MRSRAEKIILTFITGFFIVMNGYDVNAQMTITGSGQLNLTCYNVPTGSISVTASSSVDSLYRFVLYTNGVLVKDTTVSGSVGSNTTYTFKKLYGAIPYKYYVFGTDTSDHDTENYRVLTQPGKISFSISVNTPVCVGGTILGTEVDSTAGTKPVKALSTWTGPNGLNVTNSKTFTKTNIVLADSGVYTYKGATSSTCSVSKSVRVIVNPLPAVSIQSPGGPYCINSAPITLKGSPTGGTFSGPGVSGTTFTPSTAGVGTSKIKYKYTNASGCFNTDSVNIVVNDTATVVATPSSQTICSGNTTSIALTSNPNGSTFTWVAANTSGTVTGWSSVSSGSPTSITQTLTLTSGSFGIVNYTVQATTSTGCKSKGTVVPVKINPTPVISGVPNTALICSGSVLNIPLSSTPSGSTFSWIVSPVSGSVTGASGSSGSTINQTLSGNGFVKYSVTPNLGSCPGTPYDITVQVKPQPTVDAFSPTAICSGGTTNITLASTPTGGTFSWATPVSSPSAAITGGLAGTNASGPIAQTLTNVSSSVATLTYAVTATLNGCVGTAVTNIVQTVSSPPKVNGVTPAAICSGNPTSISLTSTTGGATFSWTRAAVAGVTPNTASGTGASIAETLTSTNASATTVVYAVTASAGGCTGPVTNISQVINPAPVVSPATPAAICSGGTTSVALASPTSGVTFNWTRAAVAGVTPATGSGTTNPIAETLASTNSNATTVTYVVTATAGGCTGAATNISQVINPAPIVNPVTPAAICSGGTTSIALVSPTNGATFTWTRAAVTGISPATASGSGTPIAENLTSTNSTATTVIYVAKATLGSCTGAATNISQVVNPAPIVSPATTTAICSGNPTNIALVSPTAGVTFNWTRAAVAGISPNTGLGTGTPIAETLTSTNATATTVTYLVTATLSGCTGASTTITQVVNPAPTVNSANPAAICSGNATNISLSSPTAGVTFNWTRAAVAGITPTTGTGTTSPIAETLISSNSSATTVVYAVTASKGGCTGAATNISQVVNPGPLVNPVTPAAVCSGSTTNIALTSTPAGATFTWTRAAVAGITPTTGTGSTSPIAETLTSTNATATSVMYTVTASLSGCTGASATITQVVSPAPIVNPVTTSAICSGNATNIALTSPTSGATFTWARASVAGITPATGSGSVTPIAETLISSNSAATTVTYVVNATAGGCTGAATNITQVVSPIPTVNTVTTTAICSGTATSIPLTSPTAGVTFNWTRASVAGITPATGTGTGTPIAENLTSSNVNATTVTYAVTASLGTCTGAATNISQVVNPAPTVNAVTTTAICSGNAVNIALTSPTTGATFVWTRAAVAGISPATGTGSATPINETLTSSNSVATTVDYIVKATLGTCTGAPTTISQVVNPGPLVNSVTPAAVCSGNPTNIVLVSTPAGATFTWTRAAVAGITPSTGSGSGTPIAETLTSSNTVATTVSYVVTATQGGCTGASATILQVVNPAPLVNSVNPAAICSGNSTNIALTSATAGVTFGWTRASVAGITPATGAGATTPIAEALTSSNTTATTVIYLATASKAGCTGAATSINQIVNPIPTVNAITTTPICSATATNIALSSPVSGATFTWTRAAVAGITPATGTGTGTSIAETLTSTNAAATTVTYVVIAGFAGCNGASANITQVVTPAPTVNTVTTTAICSGNATNIALVSPTTGVTFNWTRAAVAGITSATGTGTGTPIAETLTSSNAAATTVTYAVTASLGSCTGATTNITQVVKPAPIVSPVTPAAICSGTATNIALASTTSGATFTWTRAAVAGITPATSSGSTSPIAETLTSTNASATTVTYVAIASAGGCTGSPANILQVVNPIPVVDPVNPPAICSGNTTSISLTSATAGSTFTWTRAAVAGITPATGSGSVNSIAETLISANASATTVTYVVKATAGTCIGLPVNITQVVSPIPTVNTATTTAICSGNPTNIALTSPTTGVTFNWTRALVAGIAPATGTGTGTPIAETLTSTNASATTVTYAVTASLGSCTGLPTNITQVVNPAPVVDPATAAAICSGNATNIALTSATAGVTFNWTRASVAGITPATGTGTGTPIAETLTSSNSSATTVTYAVTASKGGCTGLPTNITQVVNPGPLVNPVTPAAICSGTATNIPLVSTPSGATFTWTRAAVAGITPSTGTGTGTLPITETLTSSNATATTVTYSVTATQGGCTGSAAIITQVVNPAPVIDPVTTTPICTGNATNIPLTSATTGATFTWNRAAVTGIAPATGTGTTTPIVETLTSSNTTATTVTYIATASFGGCMGTPVNITQVVNPIPTVNSLTTTPVCSGVATNILATSPVSGATFTWTRAAVSGITPTTGSGTGSPISETLTSTNTSATTVTYIVTASLGTCTGAPTNITQVINPAPTVNAVTTTAICSGNATNIALTSPVAGVTFDWTRATVAGITPVTGSGSGTPIAETLTSSNTATTTVTYAVTASLAGCTGATTNITQIVNPGPFVNPVTTTAICSGNATNIVLTSSTAGATFSWIAPVSSPAGVITGGTAATNVAGPIAQTLTNGSGTTATLTYSVTASFGGCTGASVDIVQTVNPIPVTDPVTPVTICSGSTTNIALTSTPVGAAFTWTVTPVSGTVTGASPSSGTSIVQMLTGNGVVNYIVTPTLGGCTGTGSTITVNVNATPTATATPNPSTICSGTSTNIALSSPQAGVTYSWTVTPVSGGVVGATAAAGDTISQTLIGNGVLNYIVTPALGTCNGTAITVPVTVNSTPIISTPTNNVTLCSGNTTAISLSVSPAAPITWSVVNISGTVTGASAGTGTTIAQTLTGTGQIGYVVNAVLGSCSANDDTVFVDVITTPIISATPNPIVLCSGDTTKINLSSTPATTLSWTVTNISGSVAGTSSGTVASGGVISQALTGNGQVGYVINILGTCNANDDTVFVTVNPKPVISTATNNVTLCSGNTTAISVTTTPAAPITWSVINVSGTVLGASGGTGNTIAQTLTGTGKIGYVVNSVIGSCNADDDTIFVNVITTPVITATPASSILCSGDTTNITLSSVPVAPLTWTVTNISGAVTGANGGTGTSIKDPLTGSGQIGYVINILGTCNANDDTVFVTVNPRPVITTSGNQVTICRGNTTAITMSATPVAPITWTVVNISGAVTGATAGTGNTIAQTLGGSGKIAYVLNSVLGSCNADDDTVFVDVITSAVVTGTPNPITICSGATTNITLSSVPAAPLGWTVTNISGNVTGASAGSGNTIAQTLSGNGVIGYVADLSISGCAADDDTVFVTVNPATILTVNPGSLSICSGDTAIIGINTNPVAPVTWTVANISGTITGASAGSGNSISQILTGNGQIGYIIDATQGICVARDTVLVSVVNNIVISALPSDSVSSCSGSTVTIALSSVPSVPLSWTAKNTSGIVTGATNNSGTFIGDKLDGAGIVQYIVTAASLGGCSVKNDTVVVTVNAIPSYVRSTAGKIDTVTICSGTSLNKTLVSNPAGASFAWAATESGATGSTNGNNGTVIPDVLTGDGTVLYQVIPQLNGCIGAIDTVVAVVNPNVAFTITPKSDTICSKTALNISIAVTPSTSVVTWKPFASGTVTGANAGTGSTITDNLSGSGIVKYAITSGLGSCKLTDTATVFVDAGVRYSGSRPASVCDGNANGIALTTIPSGGLFDYTPLTTNSVSGATAQSGKSSIGEALTLLGGIQDTVTYELHPLGANVCNHNDTIKVVVSPVPTYDGVFTDQLCVTDTSLHFALISNTPNATFSWTFASDPTVNGAKNGNGLIIPDTLTGFGSVTYTVTPKIGSCSGNSAAIVVSLGKTPAIPVLKSGQTQICDINKDYVYKVNPVAGVLYNWDVKGGVEETGVTTIDTIKVKWTGNGSIAVKLQDPTSLCYSRTLTLTIDTSHAVNASVDYGSNNFCNTINNLIKPSTPATLGGIYKVIPATGLAVDSVTGAFNPSLGVPGSYKVKYFVSSACGSAVDSTDVNIKLTAFDLTKVSVDTNVCNLASQFTYKLKRQDANSNTSWLVNGGTIISAGTQTDLLTDSLTVIWKNTPITKLYAVNSYGGSCPSDTSKFTIKVDEIKLRLVNVTQDSVTELKTNIAVINKVNLHFANYTTDSLNKRIVVLRRTANVGAAWDTVAYIKSTDTMYVDNAALLKVSSSEYEYYLVALNHCADIITSDTLTTILLKGLSVTTDDEKTYNIDLNWNLFTKWKNGVNNYELYRKVDDEDWTLINQSALSNSTVTYPDHGIKTGSKIWYQLKATSNPDINGKIQYAWSDPILFKLIRKVIIYNSFSPNGDGKNEFFIIDNIKDYPGNEVYILNRWGERIYHSNNYNNDWDGNGMPDGTYFYIINVDGEQYKGSIYLAR